MSIGKDLLSAGDGYDLLRELERNKPDDIRRARQHFRVAVKARVVLLPGNLSEALKFRLQGVTGDLSEGGCQALFPLPINVGDVYRLQFDRGQLELPVTFARCTRCRMLRDDAFETGFKFFNSIALPESLHAAFESESGGSEGSADHGHDLL
jgi:hypothetical protein